MSAARPASITCCICGARQRVGSRGPVPTMCRDCNRRGGRRPAEVRCADCGTSFRPADRGPVPERCWECSPRHSRDSYRQRARPEGAELPPPAQVAYQSSGPPSGGLLTR